MSMLRLSIFAAICALACQAARAEAPDYYAPRTNLDADTAVLLDAASGDAARIETLRTRLRATPAPANAADGWSFLCSFDFHTGRYPQALHDCAAAIAIDPNGEVDTFAIVKLVAREPAPRVQGSARVPIRDDMRIPVRAGGYSGDTVADTGAEISVMMQSVARKAHVRLLGPSRNVQGTTAAVVGKIGLLPQVAIGGAVIENIPVLVLPDAQLVLSSGKLTLKLPFILSLYAMADFGRIAFLNHCGMLALGTAAPASLPGATPMFWHPEGIAVPLQGPGGIHAAHFDSGANVSYLYPAALPLLAEKERARITDNTRKIGGVGGVVEEKIRRLPLANFALAGQPLIFQNIDVAAQPETDEAARLGQDVLRDYATVVFDFGAMTVSVAH